MHRATASSSWTTLLPGFVVAGAGVGAVSAPLAATAVGVVDQRRAGMGAGINNTFRQVGIATGITGLGAIVTAKENFVAGLNAILRRGRDHVLRRRGARARARARPRLRQERTAATGCRRGLRRSAT